MKQIVKQLTSVAPPITGWVRKGSGNNLKPNSLNLHNAHPPEHASGANSEAAELMHYEKQAGCALRLRT